MSTEQTRWTLHHGDCIPHMMEGMEPHSVDFAIFSPPFPSLFCYTSLPEDLGNTDDVEQESKLHFSWFFRGLLRVMKPGRVVIVHVMQIPKMARSGEKGMVDFRGLVIRLAKRAGFIYDYDWLYTKNPQSQAIRTHSHSLLFVTLERDRAKSRGALGDYLIRLIAPGENETPIDSEGEITRQEWIDWAEGGWTWDTISETDTLNTRSAKGDGDVKHICPLQRGIIDRFVRLYTNPDELVFSPFAGIGSEGEGAVRRGRRFHGCEIKPEYVAEAEKNLTEAEAAHVEQETRQGLLF